MSVFLFFPTPSPVQAVYKTSDHCHYEGWIEPYYPEASLSVQRFYSWTGSFVRIEPVWKDLKCGQKRMITVHYVLNTEGYKRISTMNFYYVVSMRFAERVLLGSSLAIHPQEITAVSHLHGILCPPFPFLLLLLCDQQQGPSSSSGNIQHALRLMFKHLRSSHCRLSCPCIMNLIAAFSLQLLPTHTCLDILCTGHGKRQDCP